MNNRFYRVFIHELGHYVTNHLYGYEVEELKIWESKIPLKFPRFSGKVSRVIKKNAHTDLEIIKFSIISLYGCVFETVYNNSDDVMICLECSGYSDLRSILFDLRKKDNNLDKNLSDLDTMIHNHLNSLPIINLKDRFDNIVNSLNVEKIQLLNRSIDVEVELNETEKGFSNLFNDIVLIDNTTQNNFQNNILDIKNFKMLNEMIQLEELKKIIKPHIDILYKNLEKLINRI